MRKASHNNIPLHKTLHFRHLREIVESLCDHEKLDKTKYNMRAMRAYKCFGKDLKGKNVSYKTNQGTTTTSCWVSDNKYDVIEIPTINSQNKFTGTYLILAKNQDFGYWIFGKMDVAIDIENTTKTNNIVENVLFEILGQYTLVLDDNKLSCVSKITDGSACNFGSDLCKNVKFDQIGVRKKAYAVLEEDELNRILKKPGKFVKESLIDSEAVEIFKKKTKK